MWWMHWHCLKWSRIQVRKKEDEVLSILETFQYRHQFCIYLGGIFLKEILFITFLSCENLLCYFSWDLSQSSLVPLVGENDKQCSVLRTVVTTLYWLTCESGPFPCSISISAQKTRGHCRSFCKNRARDELVQFPDWRYWGRERPVVGLGPQSVGQSEMSGAMPTPSTRWPTQHTDRQDDEFICYDSHSEGPQCPARIPGRKYVMVVTVWLVPCVHCVVCSVL